MRFTVEPIVFDDLEELVLGQQAQPSPAQPTSQKVEIPVEKVFTIPAQAPKGF